MWFQNAKQSVKLNVFMYNLLCHPYWSHLAIGWWGLWARTLPSTDWHVLDRASQLSITSLPRSPVTVFSQRGRFGHQPRTQHWSMEASTQEVFFGGSKTVILSQIYNQPSWQNDWNGLLRNPYLPGKQSLCRVTFLKAVPRWKHHQE